MDPIFLQDDYQGQTFQGLHLSSAQVHQREFSECIFIKCSLSDNDFEGCTFHNCEFRGCDLSLARLNNASFVGTVFKDSKLVGINWTDARWPKGRLLNTIDFSGCAINHSVFMGMNLRKIQLYQCTAREVDFTECDLSEADCRRTDFSKSRFFNTNLTGADFSGATSYTIAAGQNKIKGAKFSLPEAMSLLYNLDIVLVEEGQEPGSSTG